MTGGSSGSINMNGMSAQALAASGDIDAQNSISEYNADTQSTREAILQDQSIDSISRQELLNQLNSGDTDIGHTGDTANAVIGAVDTQLATDSSNDPLYVGRRYNEDTINNMIAQPGQAQTALTAQDTTSQGTQTLLTASAGPTTPNVPAAPGG